jgi:hypothetical protein
MTANPLATMDPVVCLERPTAGSGRDPAVSHQLRPNHLWRLPTFLAKSNRKMQTQPKKSIIMPQKLILMLQKLILMP